MSVSQENGGTDMNQGDQIIANAIRDDFELQQSQLTIQEVSERLAQTILDLPSEGTKVVSIIGGPASGKGTLVQALTSELDKSALNSDSIGTDDYNLGTRAWRWERERDDPISLKDFGLLNEHVQAIKQLKDDEVVAVPVYDEPTGMAIEVGLENFPHKVGKLDVLFVEGDFDAAENPDLLVFVDVPTDTRMQSRIDRDLQKRGEVDANKITESFKSRHDKQFTPHTAPAINKANIVLQVPPVPDAWEYDVYQPKQLAGSSITE